MASRPEILPARVLVLGESRHAVTVVRALARAGLEVTLGTGAAAGPAAWSRFVSDVWVYDEASPERFANHVEAFLRSERPDFVLAMREPLLRRLTAEGPRLERLAAWANPPFATLARCFEANAMQALAARLGMPVLPSAGARACRFAAVDGRLLTCREEDPVLRACCEAFARALDYSGTGALHLALAAPGGHVAFCGLDPLGGHGLAVLAVEIAAYRRARAAGREARVPLVRPDAEARRREFDWRDPLPELHRLWRHLPKLRA